MASNCVPVFLMSVISFLFLTSKISAQDSNKSFVDLLPVTVITITEIGSFDATVFWYEPQLFTVNTSYLEYALSRLNETPHLPGIPFDIESTTSDAKLTTSVKPTTSTAKPTISDTTSTADSNLTTVGTTNGDKENNTAETANSTTSTDTPTTPTTATTVTKSSSDNVTIRVPFVDGIILGYRVYINRKHKEEYEVFESEETRFKFSNLTPGTNFSVIISVGYKAEEYNGSIYLNSTKVTFRTKDKPYEGECFCSVQGLKDPNDECNYSQSHWCDCKEGYTGLWCGVCAVGYFSLGPGHPCRPCPCSLKYSVGTCSFYEGNIKCDQCREGYDGQLCHLCKFGYFVSNGECVRCNCHDNGDVRAKYLCDYETGACTGCLYNTTGFSCERCKEGYVGDAIKNKNCTLKADVPGHAQKFNVGVVAAVCIGVILLLSIVMGILVYRRCHGLPNKMPFWTVVLKEDHEGVNFSSLPEHDEHMVDASARMDDMDFYDSIKGHESSQKYSPLKETV